MNLIVTSKYKETIFKPHDIIIEIPDRKTADSLYNILTIAMRKVQDSDVATLAKIRSQIALQNGGH